MRSNNYDSIFKQRCRDAGMPEDAIEALCQGTECADEVERRAEAAGVHERGFVNWCRAHGMGDDQILRMQRAREVGSDTAGGLQQATVTELTASGQAVPVRVMESLPDVSMPAQERDFPAVLLQAGLTKDGKRFYPAEAIQTAVSAGLFDGVKVYANHGTPAQTASGVRDVRDWAATIPAGTVSYDAFRQAAVGMLHVHHKAALEIMGDAVARKHVGLSADVTYANAPTKIDGKVVSVVQQIKQVHSVDLVPEGNAVHGAAILS